MKHKLFELFGIDLRALAIIRIGLALVLLGDLIVLFPDVTTFFSDEGLMSRIVLLQNNPGSWFFSFHLLNGSTLFQILLLVIGALCYLALLLGWRTRLFTLLSWIFLVSLQSRSHFILTSGDYLARMLIFWGIFLPLGRRYSMDQKLNPVLEHPPKRILSMGTLGFLSQVLIVYGFAAYSKWMDSNWLQGEAVYTALASTHFTTAVGATLSRFPLILRFLNHAILYFETFGPAFLFIPIFTSPIRSLGVLAFVLMQVSFGICLDLGNFPWVSALMMLAFLPSSFFDWVEGRVKKAKDIGVTPFILDRSPVSNLMATFFLILTLLLNISIKNSSLQIPEKLVWLGNAFHLYQNWDLFVLSPDTTTSYYHWLVIRGIRKDGKEFDLLSGKDVIQWGRPPILASLYKNIRWNKYFYNITSDDPTLFGLGWHWCRTWNRKLTGDQQVRWVEVYLLTQQFGYPMAAINKQLLWSHVCFKEDLPPAQETKLQSSVLV